MSEQNEPFTPQSVDEQIDQQLSLTGQQHRPLAPETELMMDIHDLYREYAGTRDRVRRRLQEQMVSRSRTAQVNMGTVRSSQFERQDKKRKKDMYTSVAFP